MIKGYKKGNNVIIYDNLVKMELKRQKGESLWTIFDLEDLEKVLSFHGTWHATLNKSNNKYYVVANLYSDDENGNRIRQSKQVLLHMFLMNSTGSNKIHVDHIDNNPMNNTKVNLRITESSNNLRNRTGKNRNNSTGYRNVSYVKKYKTYVYRVQLMINGKNTNLGDFTDLEEAGRYAEEMRNIYYGEYAGNN